MSQGSRIQRSTASEPGSLDACKRSLLAVIESQIVPQLVRAHADQLASGPAPATQHLNPSEATIAEFAKLCHHDDETACWNMVEKLVQQHHSVPEILLNLITPAARYLGELWVQDRLDFSHVTLGLLRMQNMTHHYGFLNRRPYHQAGPKFRALVVAAPGSQHLLGLAMVSEFFVNDGWDVTVEVATNEQAVLHAVEKDWFEVVGLSVGLLEQLDTLPALVAEVRAKSLNPQTAVLLGGAAFTHLGTVDRPYGADAVCLEPLAAMVMARELAGKQPRSANR